MQCKASNDVLSLVESNERPFVVEEKEVIAQQVRVEVSTKKVAAQYKRVQGGRVRVSFVVRVATMSRVEGSELLIQNRRRASFCLMSANDAASAQRADGEAVVWP
jgi:hypothetical protein